MAYSLKTPVDKPLMKEIAKFLNEEYPRDETGNRVTLFSLGFEYFDLAIRGKIIMTNGDKYNFMYRRDSKIFTKHKFMPDE